MSIGVFADKYDCCLLLRFGLLWVYIFIRGVLLLMRISNKNNYYLFYSNRIEL